MADAPPSTSNLLDLSSTSSVEKTPRCKAQVPAINKRRKTLTMSVISEMVTAISPEKIQNTTNMASTSSTSSDLDDDDDDMSPCWNPESDKDISISDESSDDDITDEENEREEDEFDGFSSSQHASTSQQMVDPFTWEDGEQFTPNVPVFDDTNSGVKPEFGLTDDCTEIDCFEKFFDHELMEWIAAETNKFYYYEMGESEGMSRHVHRQRWCDTTPRELYCYLALMMLMPHVKKHVIQEYWRKDPLTGLPIFAKYMRRDRFLLLQQFLHFADNTKPSDKDRIWKIRHVFMTLKQKFTELFQPFQKVVIDELLVLFKGRLLFKQYIPSKRHRFGVKMFVLCDCETGIVLDLIVYTGTDIDVPKNKYLGVSGSVVLTMMEPYMDQGHILYTDNWYTSPKLAKYLVDRNTGICGTVRTNRIGMPKYDARSKRGDCTLQKCGDILSIRWHDKRIVSMLTTVNQGQMINSGKVDIKTKTVINKPDAVMDYTENMRLVDKSDMQIASVESVRKSVKWYRKLFFHLLDVSVLNAYNIYKVLTGNRVSLRIFSYNLVTQLLMKYGTLTQSKPGRHLGSGPDRIAAKDYSDRHYLDNVPGTASRKIGQRECHVCRHTDRRERKRKLVSTWCKECQVGLCIGECYRAYHVMNRF